MTLPIPSIDSRRAAEMAGKSHGAMLRSIRSCLVFPPAAAGPEEYFIASVYLNPEGRTLPLFICTEKGCELLASRMKGEKQERFRQAYTREFAAFWGYAPSAPSAAGARETPHDFPAGGVATLIRALREVMKDRGAGPEKIQEMAWSICRQFGMELPQMDD